ncbi:MAG: hypothetical protein ACETVO_05045 [bacterium]
MAERVKDPVCGMEIEKDIALGPVEHGRKYSISVLRNVKRNLENELSKYTKKSRAITNGNNKSLCKRFNGQ